LDQHSRDDCHYHPHFGGLRGRHLGVCTFWDDEDEFGVVLMNSAHGGEAELLVQKAEMKNAEKLSTSDMVSFEVCVDKRKGGGDMDDISAVDVAANVLLHPILTTETIGGLDSVRSDCWKQIVKDDVSTGAKSMKEIMDHPETAHCSFHRYCAFLSNSSGEHFRIAPVILPNHGVALHATQVTEKLEKPQHCKWMFSDAGSGKIGLNEIAHLNPWRWSQTFTIEEAVSDLEKYSTGNDASRPVRLQFFPGSGCYKEFKAVVEACAYLKSVL